MGAMGTPEGGGLKQDRTRKLAAAVLLGMALAVAAAGVVMYTLRGPEAPAQMTAAQEDGMALYNGNCATCHEANQLALKPAPPNLHHVFEHDRLPSGAPATDAEVRRVVLLGRLMMPAFGQRLTEEQIADVIAYLHVRK